MCPNKLNMVMQSFREHCQSVTESLDTPALWVTESLDKSYEWHVTQKGGSLFKAEFEVPAEKSLRYAVIFTKDKKQPIPLRDGSIIDVIQWEFTFALVKSQSAGPRSGKYGITGSGHAFAVFATVIAVMKEFIAKYRPDLMHFTATEASRAKLYDRFIKDVSSVISGYQGLKMFGYGNVDYFALPHSYEAYIIVKRSIPLEPNGRRWTQTRSAQT